LRKGDYIRTYSGQKFWILDPRPEDINIIDVAHALSMKCRFGGHCQTFYSVAQHSMYVAYGVFTLIDSEDTCLWGLLHDLAEAYLPDTPRPIKNMVTGILIEAEEKIMDAAIKRFQLNPQKEPTVIKLIDNSVGIMESKAIMDSSNEEDWSGYDHIKLNFNIVPLRNQETIEKMFLKCFGYMR
jgi:uncharacterized protein